MCAGVWDVRLRWLCSYLEAHALSAERSPAQGQSFWHDSSIWTGRTWVDSMRNNLFTINLTYVNTRLALSHYFCFTAHFDGSITYLFGSIDSIILLKASQTTSTFFCPGTSCSPIGLPSGRGYMLLVVSSSLGRTRWSELNICLFLLLHAAISNVTKPYLSSVRNRLMWLMVFSCVISILVLSRKTCRKMEECFKKLVQVKVSLFYSLSCTVTQ